MKKLDEFNFFTFLVEQNIAFCLKKSYLWADFGGELGMRLLQILLLVLCFTLTIWADIRVSGGFPQPQTTPTPEQKKQDENRTCAGAVMLTIGVFLLGRWLIRRNSLDLQPQLNR